MGYFSWLTADKKESIRHGFNKEVYLLQPNGQNPIEETFYEGFGEFGGVDAYEWLAINNLPKNYLEKAKKLMQENSNYELRDIGIYLDSKYFIDTRDNKKYCYNPFTAALFNLHVFANYECDINGSTPNKLREEKIWIAHEVSELIGGIKYPLKFSFNKNAIYEDLKPSKDCPNQGF